MIRISAPKNKMIKGILEIPASKSISNRALIIKALCNKEILINNLSISDDTKILLEALDIIETTKSNKNNPLVINIGLAGTAFRFLTAFLATQKGTFILTGEQRIQERPIKPLVNALKLLGAEIEYLEKDGFAPLLISGKELKAKTIEIDANISSQFITALLLIAPTFKSDLTIILKGKINSKPYIEMTLELMNYFGVSSSFVQNEIIIKKGSYQSKPLFVEADWSSASYFYEALSLAQDGDLTLKNYSKNSLQGDAKLVSLFKQFGVNTKFENNEIILTKTEYSTKKFEYDFSNEPDLAQTFIALCSASEKEAQLTGLESLKIKETNRISALNIEINKFDWSLTLDKTNTFYQLKRVQDYSNKSLKFKTYNDHRMAMCLAPLCLKFGTIEIEKPEVVTKSNPLFWEQLKSLGFEIESIQ